MTLLVAHPWREVELTLDAACDYPNPYTDVDVWVDLVHTSGERLRRPAFWDGGRTWRVRFASPRADGMWAWRSLSTVDDASLTGNGGVIGCAPEPAAVNRFYRHGFLGMSPGGRNLVHADGRPCLLVGDTAWALPWRATTEQCSIYSEDRHHKGFNAALLMGVQPDMLATGPRSRTEDYGFDVGFEDLPGGHINQPNIEYFQYFDRLVDILVAHEIVPIYQPLFHGYGWKGMSVAGNIVPGDEYARFCRYLVARFGARPAMYLVGADGRGNIRQIAEGGREIELWDCYCQPTGLHYSPPADNRAHQDEEWLDFQWCQTGHNGEHIPERVADMWRNAPPKALANGEPTYEQVGWPGNAAGWWQGHEAWCNVCAGGTMGAVYGAGSLWQWRLHKDEPGHEEWAHAAAAGWREALDFEGAGYVGLMSRIFDGLPFADMQPDWSHTNGRRGLFVPDKLLIVYLQHGGDLTVLGDDVPDAYRVLDPRDGRLISSGRDPRAYRRISIPLETGVPKIAIFSASYEDGTPER